ncbi:ring-opening amidohydrolase [Paenibacillus sp. HB172176]|uniref:cyanuric acid amidohydrolase n=1 Tax=Paenibacillus sp. HB172176 TaxID=2493690 RepID=UPI0014392271|nr:ring-opening amidohydrolase [Paenibacillus sp. HB172176]
MRIDIVRVPIASPSDMKALKLRMEEGAIDPSKVIAVLGKTEGNGCVNDFTRGYAVDALRRFFSTYVGAEAAACISYIMSGGTEGILSPHFTIISRVEEGNQPLPGGMKALAVGVAHTRPFLPEELGRGSQIEEVSRAVKEAMAQACITDNSDVHFVQIKCPLLTDADMAEAAARGVEVVVNDTYKSMGYSRGASALGAAIAVGELSSDQAGDEDVCVSWDKFSSIASTSAGSELDYCEVIVFGNSARASGELFMSHGVMKDAIDAKPLLEMIAANPGAEVVQVLAKAEADPTGVVRGHRHTMLNDSDINHTRQARAVVGGVLASIVGDPMIYVSGGAEHQGPAGGGPVAVIFKRPTG